MRSPRDVLIMTQIASDMRCGPFDQLIPPFAFTVIGNCQPVPMKSVAGVVVFEGETDMGSARYGGKRRLEFREIGADAFQDLQWPLCARHSGRNRTSA